MHEAWLLEVAQHHLLGDVISYSFVVPTMKWFMMLKAQN